MSHKQVLLAVVLFVSGAVLPRPATATKYVVGDADGWRPGGDYTTWAKGKEFRVGDTLEFKYVKGQHNVLNVTGPDFQSCTVSTTSLLRDSGADVITLKAAGKKWYLCGVAGHCQRGQKLVITVLPAALAPQPTPVPSPPYPSPPAPAPPTPPAPTPVPPVEKAPPATSGALPTTVFPSAALAAAVVAVAVAAMA
ncbi:hypothetical protein Taro_006982 [Colocasia esculenta]|uniref:Phytocyanin domain-containing protein n=1 Tax=Colocasia esculenta TaxID=4460 RepID=A0A843TTU5_COLES|nr:hypothetical protein [Colocasia esculenta]